MRLIAGLRSRSPRPFWSANGNAAWADLPGLGSPVVLGAEAPALFIVDEREDFRDAFAIGADEAQAAVEMHARRIPPAVDDLRRKILTVRCAELQLQRDPLVEGQRERAAHARAPAREIDEFHGLAAFAEREQAGIGHDNAGPAPGHADLLAAHEHPAKAVEERHGTTKRFR